MAAPWFWLIAGINGAGKTTLSREPVFQALLGNIFIFNPDFLAAELLRDDPDLGAWSANVEAADQVEASVQERIGRGESFGVETVLSTDKFRRHVDRAIEEGFNVGLIYIGLATPELAIQRVQDRVAMGGHDVPEDRVRVRWRRSIDQLAWFAPRVQRLLVFDNSHPSGGTVLIASGVSGRIVILDRGLLPEITDRLATLAGPE